MKLVCLDTHVLLWGIKEQADEGQEEMIPRTKAFIESLNNTDTRVLIPAVVIAEFLMRIPAELHALIINLFNQNFIVAPFDTIAASKFSEIWQAKKDKATIDELIKAGKTRAELKVDRMIVATAITKKADCIYSQDNGLATFAKGYIDVKEIPFIPTQTSAFELDSTNKDWGKSPTKMNEPT